MRTTRRTVLKGMAAVSATLAAPSIVKAADSFVTTMTGGTIREVFMKTCVEPFQKQFGVEVVVRAGTPAEWLTNCLVNRANPEIDLLWVTDPITVKAIAEGLCEEISPDEVPNVRDIYPEWFQGYRRMGVGHEYASFAIAYRTDLVKEPPRAWKDLWKPHFKDSLAIPDLPVAGGFDTLLITSKVHGGSETNIDPGFEAMKRLKPNVRKFYKSVPEAQQMLQRGEVAAAAFFNARTFDLKASGVPVEWVVPEEGALANMVAYHVIKNSKKQELAKKFLNFVISPEVQGAFCNGVGYGPTNRKTVLVPPTSERVPKYTELNLFDWWAVEPRMSAWNERWMREVN